MLGQSCGHYRQAIECRHQTGKVTKGTLKLLAVVMNGFTGYKFGYENIVFDTVNYMDDQTDLMNQAMQYFDAHPETEEEDDEDEEAPEQAADPVPEYVPIQKAAT